MTRKVLYISGFERSGTTLISNILNQSDNFISVGELGNIWRKKLFDNSNCSCGLKITDCDFWKNVLKESGIGESDSAFLQKNIKYTDNFYLLYKYLPNLFTFFKPNVRKLVEITERVYKAIDLLNSGKVIVDDMKQPLYGEMLLKNPNIDLYIVQVVRDPRGVIHSDLKRSKQNHPFYSKQKFLLPRLCVVWNLVYKTANKMFSNNSKFISIKYEDFVESPEKYVDIISNFVGEEIDAKKFIKGNKIKFFKENHHIGGHHKFENKEVVLAQDESWKNDSSRLNIKIIEMFCGRLMKKYGYKNH